MRDVDVTVSRTDHIGRAVYLISFQEGTVQTAAERENKRQQALTSGVINSIPDMVFYKDTRFDAVRTDFKQFGVGLQLQM